MADDQTNTTRNATRPETTSAASQNDGQGTQQGASAGAAGGQRSAEGAGPERRQNARLRLLVDEMLKSIRESQRRDDWTDAERERAEADLERIMAQVRRAAVDHDR